jgi:putative MATE family efflux protein
LTEKPRGLWFRGGKGTEKSGTERESMEQTVQTQEPDRRMMTKKAISVAWPAMAESFFVTLAGMIDTMMVSSLGSYAVAAVGLTNQPKFIALTLFFGINIAVSALVARRKGEQRRENANEILLTALGLTVALCAVITAVFVIFTPQIMEIAGSNADTHEAAVEYFRIIMGGTFFSVLTMVINAAQRGSGNTRLSMTTNLTSSVVNVFFNYLLINGNLGFPAWGIRGAAIATVLGTVVSAAWRCSRCSGRTAMCGFRR